ncbi:putative glycerol-3-phosphate acyltransferase, partial [Danaus plexippus plexippus]
MTYATIIFLAVITSQTYSAPQFISFKDGKLGVNFGGYHAGVGIGGLL